jgi:hypothetical protein
VKKLLSMLVAGAVAGLTLAALASGTAGVENYTVSATLKPKSEVPAPNAPAGAGGAFSGSYKENAKGAVLTWKLTFSKLSGAATAAHIHKAKPGVAGPVVVPLCGPCKSGQSGKATISKTVVAALEAGRAYVNVHTAKNAGGEIRGQVKVSG